VGSGEVGRVLVVNRSIMVRAVFHSVLQGFLLSGQSGGHIASAPA
jgi:hypothetical protein